MNPNLNVGLPIFTIHGNHDDPSGSDNLSAVDILSSCKLVNYFGKHMLSGASGQRLTISPILLQKVRSQLCPAPPTAASSALTPTAALSQPSIPYIPLRCTRPLACPTQLLSCYIHAHAPTHQSFQYPPHLPIAARQGLTRLALYGLGSIRDERLCRLFAQAGMVSW